RQLRLRDIGGIIVIDYIDMVLESNRDLVLRRMLECLSRDRTKHQVAEVTSLGLVQMTRKRGRHGHLEAFTHTCEHGGGSGQFVTEEAIEGKNGNGGSKKKDKAKGDAEQQSGKSDKADKAEKAEKAGKQSDKGKAEETAASEQAKGRTKKSTSRK